MASTNKVIPNTETVDLEIDEYNGRLERHGTIIVFAMMGNAPAKLRQKAFVHS